MPPVRARSCRPTAVWPWHGGGPCVTFSIVVALLGAAPIDPLGGVLEAVFGQGGHLGLMQKLDLLEVHELLLVLDMGIICCQTHQVVYLLGDNGLIREVYKARNSSSQSNKQGDTSKGPAICWKPSLSSPLSIYCCVISKKQAFYEDFLNEWKLVMTSIKQMIKNTFKNTITCIYLFLQYIIVFYCSNYILENFVAL